MIAQDTRFDKLPPEQRKVVVDFSYQLIDGTSLSISLAGNEGYVNKALRLLTQLSEEGEEA